MRWWRIEIKMSRSLTFALATIFVAMAVATILSKLDGQ
jgi:hypothetical protein